MSGQQNPINRKIVLVVEDEPILLIHASDIAEEAGFEVLQAMNADEAIRILQNRSDIAIVMTDVNMPGSMDGLKLATCIRDRWPPIDIIVISGHIRVGEVRLFERSAFFSKPYDDRKITAKLQEFGATHP